MPSCESSAFMTQCTWGCRCSATASTEGLGPRASLSFSGLLRLRARLPHALRLYLRDLDDRACPENQRGSLGATRQLLSVSGCLYLQRAPQAERKRDPSSQLGQPCLAASLAAWPLLCSSCLSSRSREPEGIEGQRGPLFLKRFHCASGCTA